MLELHRRVVHMKAVAEDMLDAMQDMVALRWRHIFNEHVATKRV